MKKKLMYALMSGALGIALTSSVIAQEIIDCYCMYSGAIGQVEVLEGETPKEACQTLGIGFVPSSE